MQTYRKSTILTVALAAALTLVTLQPCAAQPPVATGLGVLPGFSESMAWAINASGKVAGASYTSDYTSAQAFVWQNGVMLGLPNPQGYSACVAHDINASSQLVGGCQATATGKYQASLWVFDRGAWTVTLLGIPADYTHSIALSINDKGDVAGGAGTTDPYAVGVLWTPFVKKSGITVLKDDLGQNIIPIQMNSAGQILGLAGSYSGEVVIWKAGAVTHIGAENPDSAWINNKGEVLTYAYEAGESPWGNRYAFLYLPADAYGVPQGLSVFPTGGVYYAINDNGVLVHVDDSDGLYLLDMSSWTDTLIHTFAATDDLDRFLINASGAVAGGYHDAAGQYSAFYGGVGAGGLPWYHALSSPSTDTFVYDLNDDGGMAGFLRRSTPKGNEATAWAVSVISVPLSIPTTPTFVRKGGTVTETVTLTNGGTITATNVVVSSAVLTPVASDGVLGAPVYSSSTPISLKPIAAGATQTFTAKFAGSSVGAGTYKMYVQGTCSLGAFQSTVDVTVN